MGTTAGPKASVVTESPQALLSHLADGLRLSPEARKNAEALTERLIGAAPPGRSSPHPELGDSSYAYSLAFVDDQPEIQLSWEAPALDDFQDRVRASLEMLRRVQDVFGVSTRRLERVAPLFFGQGGQGAFAISYSARLWPEQRSPSVTAYLNPGAQGHLHGPALVEHALELLGFKGAWHAVSSAMSRGPELDELVMLGVTLSAEDDGPVEVCICHHELKEDAVAIAARLVPGADMNRLIEFLRRSTGERVGAGIEAETRLSFPAHSAAPSSVTLRMPMRGRTQIAAAAFAALGGVAAERYALASSAVGSASHVSLSLPSGRSECQLSTVSAEVASASMPTSRILQSSAVEPMVKGYEAQPLSLHPFFQRMSRQTVDVRHMWLMFSNIYAGLSQHFPRRLARVIWAVEDERIRSILTEQLHEELGSGDYTRTHRRLFLQLLESLAPWKPEVVTAAMQQPGAKLSERLEAVYFDAQPYAGVGAAIVIELLGKQVDMFVADQFRRQQAVGMTSLEWLTLHETLEVDHASESLDLASFIDREEDRAAAWRGGRAIYAAGWLFFDGMYRLCFDA